MVKTSTQIILELSAAEPEKTAAFYQMLGAETIETVIEGAEYRVFLAKGLKLHIISRPSSEGKAGSRGWDHLALTVDDVEAAAEAVVAAGGICEKKPSPNMTCGHRIRNSVCYGLSGEKIELIQYLEEKEG